MARTPQAVVIETEGHAKDFVQAFRDAVDLARVDSSAPEPDSLKLQQLTGAMTAHAAALELTISQLKHAAVVREGCECEELVVRTAERYDALATKHADGLSAIAAEVDESISQLLSELNRERES